MTNRDRLTNFLYQLLPLKKFRRLWTICNETWSISSGLTLTNLTLYAKLPFSEWRPSNIIIEITHSRGGNQ